MCKTPGLGCPDCGLIFSLPRESVRPCDIPFPLSPLPGAQVPTQQLFFSSYLITCVSFLQPWLHRSPSASFQLVFCEYCSTCIHIFNVFMGECELHVLLLHHLDLPGLKTYSDVELQFSDSVCILITLLQVLCTFAFLSLVEQLLSTFLVRQVQC